MSQQEARSVWMPPIIPSSEEAASLFNHLQQQQKRNLLRLDTWAEQRNILLNPVTRVMHATPILSHDEAIGVWAAYRNGNMQAKQYLVEANLRLVASFAKRYGKHILTEDDCFNEGVIALITSLDSFKPEKGPLVMHMYRHIQRRIIYEIKKASSLIYIPPYRQDEIAKVRAAEIQLYQTNEKFPKSSEVAEFLRISTETVEELQLEDLLLRVKSIDAEEQNGTDSPSEETQEPMDTKTNVEEEVDRHILEEILTQTVEDALPIRQGRAIKLRHGLGTNTKMTLKGIGEKMGVSDGRVGQLIESGLIKLRHPRFSRNLRDFY